MVFAVMWVIWLHQNEAIFKGRMVSTDVVVHEVEFVSYWLQKGLVG